MMMEHCCGTVHTHTFPFVLIVCVVLDFWAGSRGRCFPGVVVIINSGGTDKRTCNEKKKCDFSSFVTYKSNEVMARSHLQLFVFPPTNE
jgi:hypothetical protein